MLNEAQNRVVQAGEGQYKVIGNVGSGKTLCVIERVKELMKHTQSIVLLTYTKAAAKEASNRLNNPGLVRISTIHSLNWKITDKYFKKQGWPKPKILSKTEEQEIVYNLVDTIGPEHLPDQPFLEYNKHRQLLTELPDELKEFDIGYKEAKQELSKIDYTDLLETGVQVLQSGKYINYPEFTIVDEAQDNSPLMNKFIQLLQSKSKNLMMIGDPNQSIYQWAGADPEMFNSFSKNYPDSSTLHLKQQYRLPEVVMEVANRVSGANMIGTNKEGHILCLGNSAQVLDEARNIAVHCTEVYDDSTDVQVLTRTNDQLWPIQDQLMKHDIPYISDFNFLDRYEIKDVLNYMLVATNDYDGPKLFERFYKIANKDVTHLKTKGTVQYRNMNRRVLKNIRRYYKQHRSLHKALTVPSYGWQTKYVRRTAHQLQCIRQAKGPVEAIQAVRNYDYQGQSYGYDAWFQLERRKAIDNDIDIYEYLGLLEQIAAEFNTVQDFFTYISQFNKQQASNKEGVVLSTIHGAKGTEADIVFLSGLTEGLLPHSKGNELEEKNLFYVGITRAKEELCISSHKDKSEYYEYLGEDYESLM